MKVNSERDIQELFVRRRDYYQKSHQAKDEMVGIWHNEMPVRYRKYWVANTPDVYLNNIKRSWMDFAQMTGKEFPIYVPPRTNSKDNKKSAERVEDICYGYNAAARMRGGLGMLSLMKILAWWLVGTSDAVAIVYPDYQRKTPFFHWRDPRTHLPPEGWTPASQAPLDGTLLVHEMTLGELCSTYPDSEDRLISVYDPDSNGAAVFRPDGTWSKHDKNTKIQVGEYYSEGAWYCCTLDNTPVYLSISEEGDYGHPGVCPVVPFTLYSPSDPKGISIYDEQIALDVQVSRMFTQELDSFDRVLHPELWTSELASTTRKVGPGSHNVLSTLNGQRPFVQTVGPTNPLPATSLIQLGLHLSRANTRSPESWQGQGESNSAKALAKQESGPQGTIQDGFWPAFIDGMPKLYQVAAKMDVNLWPNEKKKASGRKNNHSFVTDYIPNVHLSGYEEDIQIEPGLGLGGYQGTIEIMQRLGAELISVDDALEALPDVRDPQAARRRIESDRLDKTMWLQAEAQAQQGVLQPTAFHDLKQLVDEKDLSISEGIAQLQREGRWLVQQAPVEPPAQGTPSDLSALLGAPGQNPLEAGATGPLPSLAALRG